MTLESLKNHRDAVAKRHRDLDEKIKELWVHPGIPDGHLTELKKQKLMLREELDQIDRQLLALDPH
jgi:hypothetical protein